ncbi:MAG: L-2-amino-thiazoline-4-carboxylic acid hydrolase [Treponema sp.]|jgi:hypothetical protein|nr:L-2-amino-thiazoline-4-carboxylic acid hydrolase [Treponema sp.]
MITNEAPATDELGLVNQRQIEHRATWMALIYTEMSQAGINPEPIIRRAIRRCGRIQGEGFKQRCGDASDCREFSRVFLPDISVKTFAMHPINAEQDSLAVDFHYCPLVTAWQKLGLSDATCALLCDMAMDGDRGIAEVMGLTLDLHETIAQGFPACTLRFHHGKNA